MTGKLAHLLAMFPFRRLAVWVKAHELTLRVFRATEEVPRSFPGLIAQLRRAVAAIPANLAEGAGHASQAQFNRFIEIALASAREADYHLMLAHDLGVLREKEFAQLEARLTEVQNMLGGLRKRVMERMRENAQHGRKTKRGGRTAAPLPSPIAHLGQN